MSTEEIKNETPQLTTRQLKRKQKREEKKLNKAQSNQQENKEEDLETEGVQVEIEETTASSGSTESVQAESSGQLSEIIESVQNAGIVSTEIGAAEQTQEVEKTPSAAPSPSPNMKRAPFDLVRWRRLGRWPNK